MSGEKGTCPTWFCIVREGHTDPHMDAQGERFTDDWAPDLARHWYCPRCRSFTVWEFRGHEQEERCSVCAAGVKPGPVVSDPVTNDLFCPSGCGCKPGEAEMRDCACDGPCVFNQAWRASDV